MSTKLLFIRVEDFLFESRNWDNNRINEHRKLLNLWIDKGYSICLVSTMDVKGLLEVQKNFYIADSGYLIGCDGGQVYSLEKKKNILEQCFSMKDMPKLERLVERIDFDNSNTALISFWKSGGNRSLFNNGSEVYHQKVDECDSEGVVVNSLIHFPEDDDSITKITLKFPNNINAEETVDLLRRLAPEFNYVCNEDRILDILPQDSNLEHAIEYIAYKDSDFAKAMKEKSVATIGYTKSDIFLFEHSQDSYTLVSCPYNIVGKATSTYMGEITNIVSYTVKELLKKY